MDTTTTQGFNGVVITKPEIRAKLNCPRCNSLNTKFCYYNNYSLSQPRHFCKTCKRYWTQGGSLRNVPVGGASRKNRRSSSSSSSSSKKIIPQSNLLIPPNPSFLSSCIPMFSSSSSSSTPSSLFSPLEELKPPLNYFSMEPHHHVDSRVQEVLPAKLDGLFDRGEGADRVSMVFGLNNGMFGGDGSLWQL